MRTGLLLVAAILGMAHALEKDRPVRKVIILLEKMQKETQAALETDDKIYKDLKCWCKLNKKEKETAVTTARARIASLQGELEECAGKAGQYKARQARLESELAKSNKEMADKDSARRQESEKYYEERKADIKQNQQLKNAINILKKHHTGLLQVSASAIEQAKEVIREVMWTQGDLSQGHAKAIGAFLQQAPNNSGSHSSASGEIFGVLTNMNDNLTAKIKEDQDQETASADGHQKFMAASRAEVATMEEQLANTKSQRAANIKRQAIAADDLSDTKDQFNADTDFLTDLTKRCDEADNQYDIRTKIRNDEITAIGEAIGILSDDDARDGFNKSVNSFLQMSSKAKASARDEVSAMLKAAADRTGSIQLSLLASTVQIDAFKAILKEVDLLVADLKQQQVDEVHERDACQEQLHSKGKRMTKEQRNTDLANDAIKAHTRTMEEKDAEITDAQATIDENVKELKRAGEQRAEENQEYKDTVANNNASIQVLQRALDRLKAFYDKKPMTSLLQQPQGFAPIQSNAGSNAILMLLENVIKDSRDNIKEAEEGEKEGQAEYEKMTQATTASNSALKSAIDKKLQAKADAEAAKVEETGNRDTAMDLLEQLNKEVAAIHEQCDFLLKNFETRQNAMKDEVEALNSAKSVLKGANFS